jgi:signal transduction histidine kinase
MRLRWQLTLSHLLAVAVTLLCMIAAIALLASLVLQPRVSSREQPVDDARTVALMIGGIAARGDMGALNDALKTLANPDLRLLNPGAAFGRPAQYGGVSSLRDVSYIVVLGPQGQVLGSSDPSGATFSPPERADWAALAGRALAGDTSAADLMLERSAPGPAALGAYPIQEGSGSLNGAVIVAVRTLPPPPARFSLARALGFFGAASMAALGGSSLFALASSSIVAYLLSRRVVRRLERLGRTAQALASGDLSARVDDASGDELGQLAARFNGMAADLQASLSQLREERDRVTGLLAARRDLVASVSHELRTPVATVRGYLESALARQEGVPAGLRGDLQTMEAEMRRLQRLIEDLSTLARAEAGRLELRLEPTDVAGVIRRTVDTIAPLAWSQWRVQVVFERPVGLSPARADGERLQQVLSNLLSNAVRHTAPGGLVVAAAAAEDDVIRIEVRDTGSGIAPEDLPHVFEQFYRGRQEGDHEGAGLGLAVAKELVEAMGGTVSAASTPGEGSCFTLRLAAYDGAAR